jgi:hypothetical protein
VAKEKFQWKKLFSIFGGKHNEVKNKPIDAEA